MSRISDAMMDTLLESITDYDWVELTDAQRDELYELCDQWEDKDSIELEINEYLINQGYQYDDDECAWVLKQ